MVMASAAIPGVFGQSAGRLGLRLIGSAGERLPWGLQPGQVRRCEPVLYPGRTLQVNSDARYRFERGLDPAAVFDGMEAATWMILELCGGEPSEVVVAGAPAGRRRCCRRGPG